MLSAVQTRSRRTGIPGPAVGCKAEGRPRPLSRFTTPGRSSPAAPPRPFLGSDFLFLLLPLPAGKRRLLPSLPPTPTTKPPPSASPYRRLYPQQRPGHRPTSPPEPAQPFCEPRPPRAVCSAAHAQHHAASGG